MHECAILLSFSGVAELALRVGQTPGLQPTPSSAWLSLAGADDLLATSGSRGTRADQGVCPTGILSAIAHVDIVITIYGRVR